MFPVRHEKNASGQRSDAAPRTELTLRKPRIRSRCSLGSVPLYHSRKAPAGDFLCPPLERFFCRLIPVNNVNGSLFRDGSPIRDATSARCWSMESTGRKTTPTACP
ncbi:MAG: hypothetical protein LBQ54_05330 [Planctomycetaceae bacterium]|nr:hypothetical protein [Planctomycetaceae bacterium]